MEMEELKKEANRDELLLISIEEKLAQFKLEKINKGVLKNIDEKAEFSKNYKTKLEPFVKKAYDLYLKKNNQSYGIKSYGLVVNLLIYDYQSKIKLSSSPSI